MGTADRTRDYYDEQAAVYDRRTGFDLASGNTYNLERYYLPRLEETVPVRGRALELGCGTGYYTRWLAERGLEVVAMDISAKMIERARLRCPASVSFAVGDCQDPAAALPPELVGDGFDALIGINTFSYYPDKAAALARYRELLRPGGRLIVLDMNGGSFTQRIAYLVDLRGARRFKENVDQSTPERLSALLAGAGFEILRMERFTFMPNAMGRVGVALLAPLERALGRLASASPLAIRIFWMARKAEPPG